MVVKKREGDVAKKKLGSNNIISKKKAQETMKIYS